MGVECVVTTGGLQGALVRVVANSYRHGVGEHYGSEEPAYSELAGVSLSCRGYRRLVLVAGLARSRTKPGWTGTRDCDLRTFLLAGRIGRRRSETLRRNRRLDWSAAVIHRPGCDRRSGRNLGAGLGAVRRISGRAVCGYRRACLWMGGARKPQESRNDH